MRHTGAIVHVEPQVFDLLVHLIRNRDRIVSKDELFEAIWQGRIVSEATLSSRISAARRALGDSGNDQTFIRTLYKRGFRFVGHVTDDIPAPAELAIGSAPALERAPHHAGELLLTADVATLTDNAAPGRTLDRDRTENLDGRQGAELIAVGSPGSTVLPPDAAGAPAALRADLRTQSDGPEAKTALIRQPNATARQAPPLRATIVAGFVIA